MLHQAAMLIIFFIAAVPKTANASNSGMASHEIFLCCPLHFTAGNAAAWQLRYSFIFLIDEIQSRLIKMKCWACDAVAAAASSFIL